MKKRARRLTLHRETLRQLEERKLLHAAGRGDTWELVTTCDCTETGCDTGFWCTTWYACPPTEVC